MPLTRSQRGPLADHLRELKKERGWSNAGLAAATEISRGAVARLVKGQAPRRVTVTTARRLQAVDTDYDYSPFIRPLAEVVAHATRASRSRTPEQRRQHARKAGSAGRGGKRSEAWKAMVIPRLLEGRRAQLEAKHGPKWRTAWARDMATKRKGIPLSPEHRLAIGEGHRASRLIARKSTDYYHAMLRIRKGMTPAALFALARLYDRELTPEQFKFAGEADEPLNAVQLIAAQLRHRRGRRPARNAADALADRQAGLTPKQIAVKRSWPLPTVYRLLALTPKL